MTPKVQNAPPVVSQHQKHVQDLKTDRRHYEEVDGYHALNVILKECPPSLGRGLLRRTMYLLTLVSPISMPSFRSSPWIRGAPQSEFSRLIVRITSRTLFGTDDRPGWPRRIFPVQNTRNALRCQATTVSGFTITSDERQSAQTPDSQTQKRRSAVYNRERLFTERRRTPIWWRSATFSNWSAARVLNSDEAPARRIASQPNVDARRLRMKFNFHDLNTFGIYENENRRGLHLPDRLSVAPWTCLLVSDGITSRAHAT